MGTDTEPNTSSPSTTAVWKWAKIQVPPEALRDSRPKAVLPALNHSELREPLTIATRFRGGSECWWELDARGRLWRAPGHLALHDVMSWIREGKGGRPRA